VVRKSNQPSALFVGQMVLPKALSWRKMRMMNESLMSINERYNSLLDRIDNIKANLHLLAAEELNAASDEIDKLEAVLKQLEDLYPEEVSGHTI